MADPNQEPRRPRAVLVRLTDEMHDDIEAYAKDCGRPAEEIIQDVFVEAMEIRIGNWRTP